MRIKAKDFFQQVRDAESRLKMLTTKRRHYEELGFPSGSIVAGTGNRQKGTSRVELAACGAADVLTDIDDQERAYIAIIAHAEDIIGKVPQEKYRQLLTYHYLCAKSLKWVSDELGYNDPNSVYRAHGWALMEAQKILDQEEDK